LRLVIQYAIDAISVGVLYALIALALALLFGVMGLMNFAWGELLMIGGYTMVYLRGQPWPLLIIVTIATVTLASVLMERVAFRPVRNSSLSTLLITSFALSITLQNLAGMTVGQEPQGVMPWPWLSRSETFANIRIQRIDLLTAVVAGCVLGGLALLLRKTLVGVQLRASTEDFEMSRLLGVRANAVIATAFAITGLLAGIVSLLYIARYGFVSPQVGFPPTLIAFVGGVIGGLGTLTGAAAGGFFLGATTATLESALPVSLAGYTQAFAFLAVILVLVFRPQGLVVRREHGLSLADYR
jgi:branched-chain amino acid transport system permease protein